MSCSICERLFTPEREALCPSCARASLYDRRFEQAAALLGREKAHTHAEAVVRPGNDGVLAALSEDADWDAITSGIKSHGFQRNVAEALVAEARIKGIMEKADKLRRQIEEYKALAERRRETSERKRKELATERTQLVQQKASTVESVQSAIKKASHRLDKVHKRTVEAREHLCREASWVNGLRRSKTEDGKTEYRLHGLLIPDLKDLNGMNGRINPEIVETMSGGKNLVEPHEIISSSMDNICRFVGTCSHYLGVRLPLEIVLPHNDFPHAAVLPRDSSYRTKMFRYPGIGSQNSSPAASRVLKRQRQDPSRPRILQLDRPLPQLQKEDPKTALFFLEGVMLLAYDLAWLCRSQGMESVEKFNDVCALGYNMYNLFTGKESKTQSGARLGMLSHNSGMHSLGGHEGFALFNHEVWPVSITRLSDQLKSYLRQEIARAEWHFIDDTEWDEELESERPVLIGGSRRPVDTTGPAMSVLSVKPSDGTDEADFPSRVKGNNGWTKIRGRGGETT